MFVESLSDRPQGRGLPEMIGEDKINKKIGEIFSRTCQKNGIKFLFKRKKCNTENGH